MLQAFYQDCVACLAKTEDVTPEEAVLVLMTMFTCDNDLSVAYQDLCFEHRRRVDNNVKSIHTSER